MDDASVNYTVKELLTQAAKTADERHEAITSQLTRMESRIVVLERDQTRRKAFGAVSNKAFGVVGALIIVLLNIPAALIAFGGLH